MTRQRLGVGIACWTLLAVSMMWRLLALCAAMVSMAMAKNVEWEEHKAKHGLSFEDEEDTERLKTFKDNLKFINEHNAEAKSGKHTYRLGVNQFTHMTNEEYRAKTKCLLAANATKWTADAVFEYDPNLTIPDEVDWRTKGYVTPIKNQGQCGSCWSFSSTGALEGQTFRKTGKLPNLSEQNLVDCSGGQGNQGCAGGWMDNSFKYIRDNKGIDSEQGYPYYARELGYCYYKAQYNTTTDTGFVDIPSGDEDALKQAVATIGPISVAIDATHPSFMSYRSGVYIEPLCGNTLASLDHAVLVVGYGTENGQDYWLVKNSWSTQWGEQGYIKMARNRNDQCGIALKASYPIV